MEPVSKKDSVFRIGSVVVQREPTKNASTKPEPARATGLAAQIASGQCAADHRRVDLAGIWRLLGGARRAPYKPFRDGYVPAEGELVPTHTQNLYVPGRDAGRTAFLVLRDRERVDFHPAASVSGRHARTLVAHPKENIGVLEATGTLIVDERAHFAAMKRWRPVDISRQMNLLLAAIAPEAARVMEFEATVRDLFPR